MARSRSPMGSVRSLLGDAARHSCHLRYRVEPTAIVTLKDEAEGKTGRRL
jgi:hypothetical protein